MDSAGISSRFAHLDFDDGSQAGIVDVPGHEKFIKNMLAGAGGIDLAMLVVAADEGFMPQTVEHLGILSLLGIRDGLVVLTKCDMVRQVHRHPLSGVGGGNVLSVDLQVPHPGLEARGQHLGHVAHRQAIGSWSGSTPPWRRLAAASSWTTARSGTGGGTRGRWAPPLCRLVSRTAKSARAYRSATLFSFPSRTRAASRASAMV